MGPVRAARRVTLRCGRLGLTSRVELSLPGRREREEADLMGENERVRVARLLEILTSSPNVPVTLSELTTGLGLDSTDPRVRSLVSMRLSNAMRLAKREDNPWRRVSRVRPGGVRVRPGGDAFSGAVEPGVRPAAEVDGGGGGRGDGGPEGT